MQLVLFARPGIGNVPPCLKEFRKKGRGSYDYRTADGIIVCTWYDNKVVCVGSNKCSVLPIHLVRRYDQKAKEYVNVECPSLIKAYNKSMGELISVKLCFLCTASE